MEENTVAKWYHLLSIGWEAFRFFPPFDPQSLLGPYYSWMPPHDSRSEFALLKPWNFKQVSNLLLDLTLPAHSHTPRNGIDYILPEFITDRFWRPSRYLVQPDPFGQVTSFQDERWFFINGIATNEDVARLNGQLIADMFYRPVTLIQNATNSIVRDLLQCIMGKSFKMDPHLQLQQTMTEPAYKATKAIIQALKDPMVKKVVVLAHSQGTIIVSNVLRALGKALKLFHEHCEEGVQASRSATEVHKELEDLELNPIEQVAYYTLVGEGDEIAVGEAAFMSELHLLEKLEVYTFANCADKMRYLIHNKSGVGVEGTLPYVENFANEYDLVARLGILSAQNKAEKSLIHIDGPCFVRKGKAGGGHLLNEHYLLPIQKYLTQGGDNPYQPSGEFWGVSSRLYQYYEGGRVD